MQATTSSSIERTFIFAPLCSEKHKNGVCLVLREKAPRVVGLREREASTVWEEGRGVGKRARAHG
jgi:hypothetical protein